VNRKNDLALACLLAVALHGAVLFLPGWWPSPARARAAGEASRRVPDVEILLPDRQPAPVDFGVRPERSAADSDPRAAPAAPTMPEITPGPAIPEPPAFTHTARAPAIRVHAAGPGVSGDVVTTAAREGAPTAGGIVTGDGPAELVKLTRPKYPLAARRRGEEGRVTIAARLNADGSVESLRIAGSSGFRELDDVASAALRHALFRPARRNAAPVPSECHVTFEFRLEDE